MQKIYVTIVSHYNDDDIISNSNLKGVNALENVTVIIRDNVSSNRLEEFCGDGGFQYSASKSKLGFGANNNRNFDEASKLGMTQDDWFVLINPDVDITSDMINKLSVIIDNNDNHIFAINLFSDDKFSKMEYSLRKYPNFLSFFNVLKGKSFTEAYKKDGVADRSEVDWAAGSFLVFKAGLYERLNGFDENYFMYFEDVDICYRANKIFGEKVVYLKDVHAVHKGGYRNRRLFSPHFRWYISSLIRFLFKRCSRV